MRMNTPTPRPRSRAWMQQQAERIDQEYAHERKIRNMTNEQTRRIAEASIAARDAARELSRIEATAPGQVAVREARQTKMAADAELAAAIDDAVER